MIADGFLVGTGENQGHPSRNAPLGELQMPPEQVPEQQWKFGPQDAPGAPQHATKVQTSPPVQSVSLAQVGPKHQLGPRPHTSITQVSPAEQVCPASQLGGGLESRQTHPELPPAPQLSQKH